MKKSFLAIFLFLGSLGTFVSCIKNRPYETTINPSMTATIGTYNFTALSVVPSTVNAQVNDTATRLIITGNSSDAYKPFDKIIISIRKYTKTSNTYSIVSGQATGLYIHGGVMDTALGGVVSISRISANSIIGYFSFTTKSGLSVAQGNFNVGQPDLPQY